MAWAADRGIALDDGAEVPLGVQLAWSVRPAVAAGRLQPGERPPALRDDIAVLERVLAGIEARLPVSQVPRGESAARTAGARVLSADDLREQRDAVVRRIALAQRALDGESDEPQKAAQPAPAPARKTRRATMPRPQPT